MESIVQAAEAELQRLAASVPAGKHIRTGEIRRLSGRLYRQVGVREIESVFDLCEEFLARRDWAMGVIAFDWAYRVRAQYTESAYPVFYRWLKKYVRGWGDCDDFCTHAFGELLRQYQGLFSQVQKWTEDTDFWVRRAAAVVLIPSILRKDAAGLSPYLVADRLLTDPHDLVRKGYGWMLKCLSQTDPDGVEAYLTATARRCRGWPIDMPWRSSIGRPSKG